MSLAAGKKKNTRSKSLSPSSINPYNQRSCKYRHPNKRIDSSSSTLQCNDCKSKIKKYGTVYGCSRCKFYLCSACFRKPSCANGHLLKATHVKRGTLCSSCQYKSKKARLQFYHCNQCKYHMCLGCYSYETCCGNHGLKWQKITNTTHKSMNHCKKCQRIFKINKSLFMCTKCKYSLCGECYQPSLTLKSKIHRQHKIAQKIKSNQNSKTDILVNNGNLNINNGNNNNDILMSLSPPNEPIIHQLNPDHLGQELKNDEDDGNRLYFDNDEEKKTDFSDEENDEDDYEEEEKKIVLTDDHLANHNNNYNYPGAGAAAFGSHQYTQSYHSYSGSNSHQTHHSRSTSNRSQANNNAPRSKSRDRPTGKKKKKSSVKDRKNRDNNNNNKGSKRKRKKKSSKTKKKNIRDGTLINNGNTPSLSLSATSSVNMQYMNDQELSSSSTNAINGFYDSFQSGIDMSTCAPSEMTRIPSILTDCCICMERDKEVAFLPCGHYIACEQCAKLLQSDTGMCAICSKKIHSIVKIFE